ncbi:MAG: DUF92 domain-containing protein [Ignavibacteriae bacterium]|nr:DUF92 domain-containing protein [Ignavibacteriota bacterium]
MVQQILIGSILAGVIALFSVKLNLLTKSGSIAAFFLALPIFGFGGLKWSIPILTFFLLSNLISKIAKTKNENIELYFEKSGARDAVQVFANGGVGALLIILNILFPNPIYYYIYLASLAAVCADTWATEIGTIFKTNTYNAVSFQKVEQGVSGGISLNGLLGAAAGSMAIALSGFLWNELLPLFYFISIVSAGLFGSYVDSLIGASFQVQYKCSVCSKTTERKIHCSENAVQCKGLSWINNDIVNLSSSLAGGLFFIIIFRISA